MNQPSIKTSLTLANKVLKGLPCRILLKNEKEQPSGSFKLRGIGNLVRESIEKAKAQKKANVEVFTSSGGNAGLAAAYSAKAYNVKCTVVLPELVKPSIVELLKSYNSKVIVYGEHWGQADAYLREEIIGKVDKSVYPVYCHPFDDPLIWQGHGNMIDEIEEELSSEDLKYVKGVVCSVGGGGLYNGIVDGLERSKYLKDVPILAMEASGAPSFAESIKQNKLITLEKVKTLATSLGAPYVSSKSLENYHSHKTFSHVIDDKDSVKGTLDYYDNFSEIVEPACGAAVASIFKNIDALNKFGELKEDDIVIIIVCGGLVTKESDLQDYRELLGSI